jgi:hypothetical protein
MNTNQLLEHIRAYCLQLPEVSERLSHGTPTFFVQKKSFFIYTNNHHNVGWVALWCAATKDFQEAMVKQNPSAYFVPPYVGHRGWLGVRLDAGLELGVLENHLLEAYCCVAPSKLQALLP